MQYKLLHGSNRPWVCVNINSAVNVMRKNKSDNNVFIVSYKSYKLHNVVQNKIGIAIEHNFYTAN